jgi:hypothetical protein
MTFGYILNEDNELYLKHKQTYEVKTQDAWEALGYDIMDDIFIPVFYEGLDEDGDEVWI